MIVAAQNDIVLIKACMPWKSCFMQLFIYSACNVESNLAVNITD